MPDKLRFELKIEGMSCVKCAGRIEETLKSHEPPAQNPRIDILSSTVMLSVPSQEVLNSIIKNLEEKGYTIKSVNDISQCDDKTKRILRLKLTSGKFETFIESISKIEGVIEASIFGNNVKICYNPMVARGTEIISSIRELPICKTGGLKFEIENPFQDEDNNFFTYYTGKQVLICVICMILLIIFSVLPSSVFNQPESWKIASIYMLFTIIMTTIIMWQVGAGIFAQSVKQLFQGLNINMITLISLGSGLAFILGTVYFIIGIAHSANSNDDESDYIMTSTQHYQTSCAIFTSVVTGKYFQGTIKRRIVERISSLKKSMKVEVASVTRVIPQNKKMDVLSEEVLHPALIERDDIVRVAVGMLPFDGYVEKGSISVMENAQFGWENVEVRTVGHKVISGSRVMTVEDDAMIRIAEPIEHTTAGKLFQEIKETTQGSSTDDKTSEAIAKFTKWFIISIFTIAIAFFILWMVDYNEQFLSFSINISYPFEKAVAILVASCPCALGTAIPMIYAISVRKALNTGVLIKESSSLDKVNQINTIVFDKTGTITGTYFVKSSQLLVQNFDLAAIWTIVSYIEQDHLQHPVGLSLYQEALKKLSELEKSAHTLEKEKVKNNQQSYFGAEGIIENTISIDGVKREIGIGNQKILTRMNAKFPKQFDFKAAPKSCCIATCKGFCNCETASDSPRECCGKKEKQPGEADSLEDDNKCCCDTQAENNPEEIVPEKDEKNQLSIYVVVDQVVVFKLVLNVQESLKDNVPILMNELRKRNIELHLLTGDNYQNALETAQQIGIPDRNVKAGVTPQGKEEYIRGLVKDQKRMVMMVGDGINDIKAFKEATLSCTINFKSSQNLSFSSFVILDNDVENIVSILKLGAGAKFVRNLILFCSIAYNIPIILLASGFIRIFGGGDLPAFMAAWTMFASSIVLSMLSNIIECLNLKRSRKATKQEEKYKVDVIVKQ